MAPLPVIGQPVKAKAVHIMDKSECSRRYGSLGASRMLYGFDIEVI
jgi:hypothetical protein